MFPQIHYIFDELKRRNLFLVTAESLTGGLIAKYITDVPGASGGTPQLPVGTVCIACASNEHTACVYSEKYLFSGTRDAIREQTYTAAMQMLLQRLKEDCQNR